MKPGPDPTTIYRIARDYYRNGLSQEEIGRQEGFSRSQISRLIDKAKDMGMVRIELVPPSDFRSEELVASLERELGLRKVILAPLGNQGDHDSSLIARAIATAAADYLPGVIRDYAAVGLGWGRTVYATSEQLAYVPESTDHYFLPLVGISGDDNPNLQINTIIDRFSAKFKGRGLFVNIPAVREKGAGLGKIEQERLANLREHWHEVEVAVIGLGDPPRNSSNLITEFPDSYRTRLCASDVCGDILSQFFFADGRVFRSGDEYERLAFDIEKLPSLGRVICLAGGPGKVKGIAAAARARYFTDLVTDESTALKLYEGL